MKKNLSNLIIILLIIAQVLCSCNTKPKKATDLYELSNNSSDLEEGIKSTPTPIPNKRAEAVLDDTFSRYLVRAVENEALISAKELEELQEEGNLYLIDLRNPLDIKKKGYIPGAVSIPLRELGRKSSVLPDFSDQIVVYCEEAWQCVIAQAGLGVYGWELQILEGGTTQWEEAGGELAHDQILVPEPDPFKPAFPCCGIFTPSLDTQDAQRLSVDAPDTSLVAAINRMFEKVPPNYGSITPEELVDELGEETDLLVISIYQTPDSKLADNFGAKNFLELPFGQLVEQKGKLPSNLEVPIVVYSQNDADAIVVMTILWTYGYFNTRSLIGGSKAWSAMKNP